MKQNILWKWSDLKCDELRNAEENAQDPNGGDGDQGLHSGRSLAEGVQNGAIAVEGDGDQGEDGGVHRNVLPFGKEMLFSTFKR